MASIPDTLTAILNQRLNRYEDSLYSAIHRTGKEYRDQTGDNGAAIETLILVLIGIAIVFLVRDEIRIWRERKDREIERRHALDIEDKRLQARKESDAVLRQDRENGRAELLGAVGGVKEEAMREIAEIKSDNVGRDKRIAALDSRTSKIEGKLEK